MTPFSIFKKDTLTAYTKHIISTKLLKQILIEVELEAEITPVGIATTTATTSIVGTATTFTYEENSNYLQVPPNVIGVTKLFHFDGTNTVTNNMFSVRYQMFLNDIYYWGATEMLTYAMTKTYLEDINFLLTTDKQIRFNKRQDRLYLDLDWSAVSVDDYLIIQCHSTLDPNDYARVYNDSFLKPYLTALIKRQWGMNMMKFTGVKLPGGVELNGRQMYDDAEKDHRKNNGENVKYI